MINTINITEGNSGFDVESNTTYIDENSNIVNDNNDEIITISANTHRLVTDENKEIGKTILNQSTNPFREKKEKPLIKKTREKKISIDTPLNEIVLRRYEKPIGLNKRDYLRRVCLSLGILQPGDSRDIIIDILNTLVSAREERKELSSEEVRNIIIKQYNEDQNTPEEKINGIAASNIRRQLKRLRDMFIIEKNKNRYRLIEFNSLYEIFEEKIEKILVPNIIERVKDYLSKV